MEKYERKYKNALEQAKQELKACGSLDCDAARQIFRLFPELQKSEDERVKTNIIKLLRFVRDTHHQYFDECNEAINWFEKQQGKSAFESVKEEKVDDANKVEPKFKAGDWIISNDHSRLFRRIVAVDKSGYGYTTDCGYYNHNYYDNNFHLWTIQDAKDGDVLATDNDGICIFDGTVEEGKYPFAYCGVTERGFEFYDGKLPFTHANVQPATKEQRDLLFRKLEEAGYKWDSSRKELIKYE